MFITDHSKGEKVTEQVVFRCATRLTQAYMIDAMYMCKVHPDDPNYWITTNRFNIMYAWTSPLSLCVSLVMQNSYFAWMLIYGKGIIQVKNAFIAET